MKIAIKILLVTLLATLFYTYVGQMVPQKEVYPPEETSLSDTMTTEELVAAGKKIAEEKGTCFNCHTIGRGEGGRFPDLAGIGARANKRRAGTSDVDYLAEALYEPNAFIVEGYNPGMPPIHKPPVGLTDPEILAVIAYLQSLGGTPSVDLKTKLKYAGTSPSQTVTAPPPSAGASGESLVTTYGCNTCHDVKGPNKMVGPSLYDVGKRLNKPQLYESILEPDTLVAEGFPKGIMSATLNAGGFYSKATTEQLRTMVDYLSTLKGQP